MHAQFFVDAGNESRNCTSHGTSGLAVGIGEEAASPDFSQGFYCGTAMPCIDCVALDLGAQRTASTLPRLNLRAPCHYTPLRPLATELVRNPR